MTNVADPTLIPDFDPLLGMPEALPTDAPDEMRAMYVGARRAPYEYKQAVSGVNNDAHLTLEGKESARKRLAEPMIASLNNVSKRLEDQRSQVNVGLFNLQKNSTGVSPDPDAVARHAALFTVLLTQDDVARAALANRAAAQGDTEVLLALFHLPACNLAGAFEPGSDVAWRDTVRVALQTKADPVRAALLPTLDGYLQQVRTCMMMARRFFEKEVGAAFQSDSLSASY